MNVYRPRLAFACLIGLLLAACAPVPRFQATYDPASLQFSGDRAFQIETEYVTRFPNRDSGKPNNQLATAWFRDQLTRLGWSCQTDGWQVINYSKPVPLNNVACELSGASPMRILVVAHHDQSPLTVQGADNDASGIAILLHLGEIFARESPGAYTLVLLSADAEEYGMLGTRRYLQTRPEGTTFIAGVSLDNLGKALYDGLTMDPRGQFQGYGSLWLQQVAQAASRAAGDAWVPTIVSPLDQALNQAVPVSFMDEGPLVAAGIPSFGLAGLAAPGTAELHWKTYHDPSDTLEFQSASTLHQSGRAAEALIRQLMTMREMPQESGPYLYLSGSGQVLRGLPLWLIFGAFVVMFFAASVVIGRRHIGDLLRSWTRALPGFLGLWLPMLVSIALLYLFVAIGVMDKYALYPATTKDPALTNPRWPAVILFLTGLAAFLAIGRMLAGRFVSPSALPTRADRRTLGLLVVGLAGLFILLTNPFSLLFMVPLLFWVLMGGRTGIGRALDILLFLLGGLLIFVLIYFFGFLILHIGLYGLWFLMIMFSIGMVPLPTAAVITAVIAAGLSMIVDPPAAKGRSRSGAAQAVVGAS